MERTGAGSATEPDGKGVVRQSTAQTPESDRVSPVGVASDGASASSGGGRVPTPAAAPVPADGFSTVEQCVADLKAGKFVVVLDDYDRENEGDLILPAELATPAHLAFMVRYTSGVICVAAEASRLRALALPPMVARNEDPKETAFTVSVDYRHGTTTGISAHDRALTIRNLADPSARAADFHRPGHVFPLRYRRGGVRTRRGHTEAAVDLARLCGCAPVGALAEIQDDDGTMSRLPSLRVFAERHGLRLLTIADLAAYRARTEGGGGDAGGGGAEEERQAVAAKPAAADVVDAPAQEAARGGGGGTGGGLGLFGLGLLVGGALVWLLRGPR